MMKRLLGLILAAALALPLAAGAQWGSIYSARHNAAGGGFTGAGDTVSGATSGGIPYFSSTTGWASSALLGASAVVLGGGAATAPFTDITNLVYSAGSGPRLQVGSGSTTLTGMMIGRGVSSGYGMLINSNLTVTDLNAAVLQGAGGDTFIGSVTGKSITINPNNGASAQVGIGGAANGGTATAGYGMNLIGGTAVTDVPLFLATRTNNNAAVATGVKITFTDTASSASFLPFQVLGGAAGTTSLLALGKGGDLTIPSYLYTQTQVIADNGGLRMNSGGYKAASAKPIGWTSTSDSNDALDSALSRVSAGVVGVGTGAAGSVAGQLHAGMLQASLGTALTLTQGAVGMSKMTASASAPGASGLKLEVVCGTNAGSAKIVAAAGTSATAVTVIDNVGSGVSGC